MDGWIRRLVESSPVTAAEERERARLLSGLLGVLLVFGVLSAAVQWWLDPAFSGPPLWRIGTALTGLGIAFGLSRTPYHAVAAWMAVVVPMTVASVQGLLQPQDGTWWAFMLLSPLFASMFLPTPVSSAVAVFTALIATTVLFVTRHELEASRWVAPMAFHLAYAPLLVTASVYRDRVERGRRAELAAREAALGEARRMESIGRLAGGIAHDFNNLLTVVLANAELVGASASLDERTKRRASEIVDAAARAGSLTRQLLAFARRRPVAPQPTDVGRLVEDLAPMLRRLVGEGVAMEIRHAVEPAVVMADPSQLEQVLLNLVANARDAMPGGGKITLSVGTEGGRVILSVRDTGVGMDAANLARVFEPFFTTKAGGVGIGLATTRGIVTDAGGTIGVRSQPGAGAEFRVDLPRCAGPAVAGAPPRPRTPVVLRILLVDDDADTRAALFRVMEAHGHEVVSAPSGEAAIASFAERPFDALVTDVTMPEMSGPALAARLRERREDLPVLFLSGREDVSGLSSLPRSAVLEKPPRVEALLDKLHELVVGA